MIARAPAGAVSSRPAASTWLEGVRRVAARGVVAARSVGTVAVGLLDGLVAGLVVAYVVATAVSGPAKHLGIPWPLEVVLTGLLAGIVALAGAVAGRMARGSLLLVGSLLDRAACRIAPPWRRSARLRAIVTSPARLLRALPIGWLGALAVVLIVANMGGSIGPFGLVLPVGALGGYVVLAGIVTGLALGARRLLARPGPRSAWRRGTVTALVAVAITASSTGALIMLSPGAAAPAVRPMSALDGTASSSAAADALGLADPGLAGPFTVRAVSYGSGTDRVRPEFGADVDVRTGTVDASPALGRLGFGADEAREWFWGFGITALPLNGLAWLPAGDGPFPLVLMVHGNHAMGDFSEPGYAYLGEHLASRGFVAVSVDEDFLNGSWAGDWGGSEQLARAWFLLLHLDQWRTWTNDPASPFHGLVDMGRVALIGHSRGGEASAVAAMLAQQDVPPALGLTPWPIGLHVRAVVAIAPSDGQYSRGSVFLRDTDFLTLQGGHDGDATSWMGIRQYARTVVGDGGFRAALWSYRSNHGQFSTVWGRSDQGPLGGALLDLGSIQAPAAQEDVSKTAIAAFLEASLHGSVGYRDLFRRPMTGREWLPDDDIFLVRSSDDGFMPLTSGGAASGIEGVSISTSGFDSSRWAAVPLRSLLPDQLTTGTELRWSPGVGAAVWQLRGIGAVESTASASAVTFSLANAALGASAGEPVALDPRVELTTSDGISVALPLSRWGALPPPLPVQLVKSEPLARLSSMDVALDAPVERVLQTWELPLADFAAVDPAFRPDHLDGLRLVFDRGAGGGVWITEVGLTRG